MTLTFSRLSSLAAAAGAMALAAVPASAAEMQLDAGGLELATTYSDNSANSGQASAYADPWTRRYRRRHHRRGIDVGDVVAGVLILGALATIVDAADGDDDRRRDRRERDRDWDRDRNRDDDRRRNDRSDDRGYQSNGIANAADMCVDQVERGDTRVGDVTSARRTPDGWRVTGTLTSGDGWNCWIDNDGRIRSVDFGDQDFASVPTAQSADRQWSDEDYARARANVRTPAEEQYTYRSAEAARVPETPEGPQPAYPGGPLPGEEGYGEPDADLD